MKPFNFSSKHRESYSNLSNRIKRECPHDQWQTLYTVTADNLFDSISSSGKEISFEGLNLKKCRRCGKIEWPSEIIQAKDVLEQITCKAESLLPLAEKISIRWGHNTRKTSRNLDELSEMPDIHLSPKIPNITLNNVILPQKTKNDLKESLIKIQNYHLIYEEWGLGKIDSMGRGVSLNFYGPTGTGKTRTAEALAGELQVPFLRISAGELESKFMGDTPKNIRKAFQSAKESGALLFFDEAESLFGKRASTVTQGVDHEVNVSKSTLLMEMEQFQGVLVLASNFQEIYDVAFRRRIMHHIRFELPDRNSLRGLLNFHIVSDIPLKEDRDTLLEKIVDFLDAISDPEDRFSGADILTMVRLALPAAIASNPSSPVVELRHFEEAIQKIISAKHEVGRRNRKFGNYSVDTSFYEPKSETKNSEQPRHEPVTNPVTNIIK